MPSLVRLLRRLGAGGLRTIRECRRCGTTVEAETDACPACESTEIATYRLES